MSRHLTALLRWWHTAPGAPRQPTGTQVPWRRMLPVAVLGILFAAGVLAVRLDIPTGLDPLEPYEIGYFTGIHEEIEERGLTVDDDISQYGYDGQWFLGQALDPLALTDLATTFDNPRYRWVRVSLPAAGWLLGAGQPGAIPYTLLLVQILAVGLGCAASGRIVSGYGRSHWWGAAFPVIPGVMVGIAYVTAEPLGVALAALAISLLLDRRYGWAGLAFAATALTKETYLAFAVGAAAFVIVDSYVHRRGWLRPVVLMVAPVAVALPAWYAYVQLAVPPDSSPGPEWSTFDRFSPPFVGWVEVLVAMVTGGYDDDFLFPGGNQAVLIGSFVILVAALALALRLRQTLLAYLVLGWGPFGLIIAGFMLERFSSAQRALAPAIFVTLLLLITARPRREPPPSEPDNTPSETEDSRLVPS